MMPSAIQPLLVPRFEFYVECATTIGNMAYLYFCPIEIGGFVLQFWTSVTHSSCDQRDGAMCLDPDAPNVRFSLSLYGPDGSYGARDERLNGFKWAPLLQRSWQQDVFSKHELLEVMLDLHNTVDRDEE